VRGDICTQCCGTEREVTVDCPLDCEYLVESRKHEKPHPPEGEPPYKDIDVSENLLRRNEALLAFLSSNVVGAALNTPGVVDFDVREALDGLVRTYRTLQSGVYYESRPSNPLAAAVFSAVQEALADYRKEEQKALGMTRTRDADVLGLLVFLLYFERDRNNGRRRGRAFIDALRGFASYPESRSSAGGEGSSLVLP
jgi:hypothetical protein